MSSTPNFSADSLGKHTEYVNALSQKYIALSKLVEDKAIDALQTEDDDGRIIVLRGRVKEAWSRADGNPSSGRWTLLSQLLRMGVTCGRGGKWVGARSDINPPECPINESGWLNTTSESEWKEWERKFNKQNMVETWRKGVQGLQNRTTQTHASESLSALGESQLRIESGVAGIQNTKSVSKSSPDPLKDSAPFGFGVVQRSKVLNIKTPATNSKKVHETTNLPINDAPESSKQAERQSKEQIANAAELSALHPSFSSSKILTSTPKKIVKPTTTPLQGVSSPFTPMSSSPAKRALLGRARSHTSEALQKHKKKIIDRGVAISPSLPAIPSSERHMSSSETNEPINENNKRTLDSHSHPSADSDECRSKRLKTISSEVPKTPPRDQTSGSVPTLTELLASAKKVKKKRGSIGKPSTSGSEHQELRQDNGEADAPAFFGPSLVDDDGGGDFRKLNADDTTANHDSNIYDFDADVASPIQGEIDKFVLDSSFQPFATSTQVQGEDQPRRGPFMSKSNTQPNDPARTDDRADSWESIYAPRQDDNAPARPPTISDSVKNKNSFLHLAEDSEFDSGVIAAQIEEVNKLLQRDVQYVTYHQSDSEESLLGESPLTRGQNNDGYGYGKAFDYDQSF